MTKAEDVLKAAIELYGEPNQLIVCMEELSELSKELAKCLRGYDSTAAITEEIADVEITLEELKIIFSNQREVDAVKEKKLTRLVARMESGTK